ncbi:hypothetical protein Cgig2_005420 [Carnegiea gigantea]|uniref:Reverse transcriptase zinc-binding domain-containing protein n=1 Tax=Carnegiea gigantea TaxID=171969 RepID=A0A9Q1KBZ9_9CARY|nr:hypothetical protein Cgig2_005420 [Carnegiea gigantea]
MVFDIFSAMFEKCGFYDLDFSGYEFTWKNRRGDGKMVEERFGRFYASIEWSLMFQEAEVFHLDEYSSYRLLILLRLHKNASTGRRKLRHFKFENIWVYDESCKETIKEAWGVLTYRMLGQICKVCLRTLMLWNDNSFRDIKGCIQGLEAKLRGEWRRKEEILHTQRAMTTFLKYDDSNLRWFHATASMRRITNTISKLERRDGSTAEEGSEFEKIITEYFVDLFSYSEVRDLDLLANMFLLMLLLDVSTRIKLFGQKVGVRALAKKVNLASIIQAMSMKCAICSALEDTDVHMLFLCPLEAEIWKGSDFGEELWQGRVAKVIDTVGTATEILNSDNLGEFLAVM